MQKTILKQNYENFAASSQEGLDKTYDRFQKLISQLEIHGEVISQKDANLKLLRTFVSSDNSSSTNEIVNTAHSVSTASSKDQASTASYADDIDADDLEEMDLKWQVAMLTVRVSAIGGHKSHILSKLESSIQMEDFSTVLSSCPLV
ncbi:hypothetical protein Tco_1450069 [Tanacetum coccineum]